MSVVDDRSKPAVRADAASGAPTIVSAEGAWLVDDAGSRWFDACGATFGPGHPGVTAAMTEQLDRVALSSRVLISRPLAHAVAGLARFCPAPLELSYLCNSGDEALDFALKLARGADPERRTVLGIAGEDFGALAHGTALRHGSTVLPEPPLAPGSVPAAEAESLPERVDGTTAAVVVAPAAPGRALDALPGSWWRALRRRCRETGALLVADERLTGPARLGSRLGCLAVGVTPDVLVLGEQLGAGVPVGVTVTSRHLYERVLGHRNPTVHGSTFGANPLSAAAARAVLDAVAQDDLVARARDGERVLRRTWEHLTALDTIVDGAVDGTLAWLRLSGVDTTDAFCARLARRHVLARRCAPDLVAFLPPLTTGPDELSRLADEVRAALSSSDDDDQGGRP